MAGTMNAGDSKPLHRLYWIVEALYGVAFGVSIWVIVRSTDRDNLGSCSFETGYERQTGSALLPPAVLLLVGGIGIIGTAVFRTRRPGDARFRVLFVLATLVFVASVVALVAVAMTAAMHPCD